MPQFKTLSALLAYIAAVVFASLPVSPAAYFCHRRASCRIFREGIALTSVFVSPLARSRFILSFKVAFALRRSGPICLLRQSLCSSSRARSMMISVARLPKQSCRQTPLLPQKPANPFPVLAPSAPPTKPPATVTNSPLSRG